MPAFQDTRGSLTMVSKFVPYVVCDAHLLRILICRGLSQTAPVFQRWLFIRIWRSNFNTLKFDNIPTSLVIMWPKRTNNFLVILTTTLSTTYRFSHQMKFHDLSLGLSVLDRISSDGQGPRRGPGSGRQRALRTVPRRGPLTLGHWSSFLCSCNGFGLGKAVQELNYGKKDQRVGKCNFCRVALCPNEVPEIDRRWLGLRRVGFDCGCRGISLHRGSLIISSL